MHFTYRTRNAIGRWELVHLFATDLNAAFGVAQSRNISFRDLH